MSGSVYTQGIQSIFSNPEEKRKPNVADQEVLRDVEIYGGNGAWMTFSLYLAFYFDIRDQVAFAPGNKIEEERAAKDSIGEIFKKHFNDSKISALSAPGIRNAIRNATSEVSKLPIRTNIGNYTLEFLAACGARMDDFRPIGALTNQANKAEVVREVDACACFENIAKNSKSLKEYREASEEFFKSAPRTSATAAACLGAGPRFDTNKASLNDMQQYISFAAELLKEVGTLSNAEEISQVLLGLRAFNPYSFETQVGSIIGVIANSFTSDMKMTDEQIIFSMQGLSASEIKLHRFSEEVKRSFANILHNLGASCVERGIPIESFIDTLKVMSKISNHAPSYARCAGFSNLFLACSTTLQGDSNLDLREAQNYFPLPILKATKTQTMDVRDRQSLSIFIESYVAKSSTLPPLSVEEQKLLSGINSKQLSTEGEMAWFILISGKSE